MKGRIAALMEKLPKDVDAALIQSEENRRYLTGMQSSAGTVLCFREEAYFLVDFRYLEKAQACVKNCIVVEQHDLYPQILRLLQEHHAREVCVESMTMTLYTFSKLQQNLGGFVRLQKSEWLSRTLYACRTVKTAEEIEKIKKAQRIAEVAFSDILTYIKPGVSERDIMLRLDRVMLENGSDGASFPTIALTGAATSMPHGTPSATRIVQRGDFVLMDYGATVDGYHSDMTRTVCVGNPSERMRQVYEVVAQAQNAAIQAAKAGMTGRELDKIARDMITEAGFGAQFGHSLGHGVGLEIHEYPNASPGSKAVLESGNVVTIEPGIYLPGEFGVRIEDFVVIRENGCENLTQAPKHFCII